MASDSSSENYTVMSVVGSHENMGLYESNGQVHSGVLKNGNGEVVVGMENRVLIELLSKVKMAMVNEIKDELYREIMGLRKDIVNMVREELQSSLNTLRSNNVQFSSNEMIMGMASSRGLPALSALEEKKFERNWHFQHMAELEAVSKRLALLQEECHMRMEKLRAAIEEQGP